MDNELLMPLVMNHSNNSGLFKKIHVFHCENMNFYNFAFRKLTKDKASGGKSSGGSSGGGNKKSGGGNKVNDSLDFRWLKTKGIETAFPISIIGFCHKSNLPYFLLQISYFHHRLIHQMIFRHWPCPW